MQLADKIDRILERFLATPQGQAVRDVVEAEDLGQRGVYVRELADAQRWRDVEFERLGQQRRPAAEDVNYAKAALAKKEAILSEIDRAIAWTRSEAERRERIARRELLKSAPAVLDDTARALRDLESAARGQFSAWQQTEQTVGGSRTRVTTNTDAVQAVIAAIRSALDRVEALRLEALTTEELGDQLTAVRAAVLDAARVHGIPLRWPA